MRNWFAQPVLGAGANVVAAVVSAVVLVLTSHRARRSLTLLGVGLFTAGWVSNLTDRLGVHRWTAPGSARGVVDFIPTGMGYRGNVADVVIALGSVLLAWRLVRPRAGGGGDAAIRPRPRRSPGTA